MGKTSKYNDGISKRCAIFHTSGTNKGHGIYIRCTFQQFSSITLLLKHLKIPSGTSCVLHPFSWLFKACPFYSLQFWPVFITHVWTLIARAQEKLSFNEERWRKRLLQQVTYFYPETTFVHTYPIRLKV